MAITQAHLEQYWRPMVRVARGVLGSPDEAEECAAAAILQVLGREPDAIENMEAFMVTVAKRRAVDRQRALSRAHRRDARLAAQSAVTSSDIAEGVVQREAARWISAEAARLLTPQSHRILVAVANEEDLREVAAREGMSLRAVQSDLFRTRRLLRSVWARALAAAGVLWAGCRQVPLAAAPTVAAALALTLIPVDGPRSQFPDVSVVEPAGGLVPKTAAFIAPAASPTTAAAPPSRTTRHAASALAPPVRRAHVASVQDPAGRTVVYTDRHGDGEDAGLVGGAAACLGNLSLDPHQLGC